MPMFGFVRFVPLAGLRRLAAAAARPLPSTPAAPLPEPGLYVFQGEGGPLIPLVRHAADDDAQVHFLRSPEAAAQILRAFGGDPRLLGRIPETDPEPGTP